MPKLLIETRMNSLSLCESSKQSKHPGCLGTIAGPCASYKDPTRNGRFYSRKLWENVFQDDIVKESLRDRILLGELDHPGDRLETKATNAAIVMTGYEFDDDNGVVNGTFDILDTPNGRIMRSLLDYGCKLGVSSRGEGDVFDDPQYGEKIDEDSYMFVGFDAVVLPAVKVAKPALQESMNREKTKSLKESLRSEIKSATTASELTLIKKLIEATGLPDAGSLIESVDNKAQELKDGATSSSSTTLLEDLEKATLRVDTLEKENRELSRSVTTSEESVRKLTESNSRLTARVSRQKSRIHELESENSRLQTESLDLSLQLASETKKVESLEEARNHLARKYHSAQSLCESHLSEIKNLRSEVNSLSESLNASRASMSRLTTRLQESRSEVQSLTAELKTVKSESKAKLTESMSRHSSQRKSYSGLLESYIREVSCREGVDADDVKKLLRESATACDVDHAVSTIKDAQDRYSKLPVTGDVSLKRLVESARTGSTSGTSDETDLTEGKSIMQLASKYF